MVEHAQAGTAEPAVDTAEIQAISDWLIGRGLMASDFEETLTGFCERLVEAGVPLSRGMISMRTLHPTIDAVTYVWKPDTGTVGQTFGVDGVETPGWKQSPLNYLINNEQAVLRCDLTDPDAEPDFPVFEEFRRDGGTDYFARMVRFDIDPGRQLYAGMISSWITTAPGGFDPHHIAILERLIPRFALSVNANLVKQIAVNVLDTYVGPDAGRRIMGGEIHRSEMQVIRAVMLHADLRGFTALTDSLPGPTMIDLLDAYFDRLVPAIVDRGGQILKFLGDGLLATFDLRNQPRDAICRNALTAASEAIQRVSEFNDERRAADLPVMALDIALHLGDVYYGNIGAADRLDFTVIGPAVNEVGRIEALCDALDRHILVSEAFAAAATACNEILVPLGRHELRGVREPQEIYGVALPTGA